MGDVCWEPESASGSIRVCLFELIGHTRSTFFFTVIFIDLVNFDVVRGSVYLFMICTFFLFYFGFKILTLKSVLTKF